LGGLSVFIMLSNPYSLLRSGTGSNVGFSLRIESLSSATGWGLAVDSFGSEDTDRASAEASLILVEPESTLGRDDSCDFRAFSISSFMRL
jgi:hypothetical protein